MNALQVYEPVADVASPSESAEDRVRERVAAMLARCAERQAQLDALDPGRAERRGRVETPPRLQRQ